MGVPVLIYGKSGSGKSTACRNFTPEEVGIINVIGKTLPFRNKLKTVSTASYKDITKMLCNSEVNTLVIDDATYLMTDYFMQNHASNSNGYAVYNEIGDDFYTLIKNIKDKLPPYKIVYIIMHEDGDEINGIKPKTLGKMLNNIVTVEGLFTIALRAIYKDGGYYLSTQTDGIDVTKAPMEMFEQPLIDNDLKNVDETIREYWDLYPPVEKDKSANAEAQNNKPQTNSKEEK